MRRFLTSAAVFLLAGAGAGPAAAKLIVGTSHPERIVGTKRADRIAAEGGGVDRVRCGAGRDVVTADLRDRVAADCEVVSRRVSRDPYANASSQHQTQVEPESFAYGSTVVDVFQSGRFFGGGASNIGWASSTDGGKTWRSGFLPGLTQFSALPGAYARVSDPSVAYDAAHGVWLVASLAFSTGVNAMLVSRSPDGSSWSPPVTAVRSTSDLEFDKEWIACDNWASSPFRGHCYLSYADFGLGRLVAAASADGGRTWSAPVPLTPAFRGEELNGVQPAVRPDGTLVVLFSGDAGLQESISADGGTTFGPVTEVARLSFQEVPRIRSSPFASVEVDAAGTIFAAWTGCAGSCGDDEIMLASSADGRTWTQARRVPAGPRRAGVQYFTPGLAADAAAAGHLGIAYYRLAAGGSRLDAFYVGSRDGGASWGKAQRLSARAAKRQWLAATNLGRMVGDYVSTSFAGGRPLPVFAFGSPPVHGRRREATFVTVRGLS